MRIQYVGGAQSISIRDIRDPAWNRWNAGDTREIPAGATVTVTAVGPDAEENATTVQPLAEALFRCGKFFVDAETGKNPLLTCATCGGDAFAQGFRPDDNFVPYATEDGTALCPPCFLHANPQHVAHHELLGMSRSLRAAIAERVEKAAAAAATPARTSFITASAATAADNKE